MARSKGRVSQPRKVNPIFFVFCEGETEEAYVKFLRSTYRIPIEIDTKRAGNKITQRYVDAYLHSKPYHEKDEIFLFYDLDTEGTLERLNTIRGKKLVSNPCVELWFLLHFTEQTANIASEHCVQKLGQACRYYQKGELSPPLQSSLINNTEEAIDRAKRLNPLVNPSSSCYLFIEKLEDSEEE